jgi:hypothetical protein
MVMDCIVLFFAYQEENCYIYLYVPQTLHVTVVYVRSPYYFDTEVSMTRINADVGNFQTFT